MQVAMGSNPDRPEKSEPPALVLFDGNCNLCNTGIRFILKRDSKGFFRFCAAQSETAKSYLERYGIEKDDLSSVVLIEDGRCYKRSQAGLRIVRRLRWLWPLLYGFVVVPRPLRDACYRWVAKNRYKWFGRSESCFLTSSEYAERFLGQESDSRSS